MSQVKTDRYGQMFAALKSKTKARLYHLLLLAIRGNRKALKLLKA